jgi:hypothetical protein
MIALATAAIAIVIARHPRPPCNCPLCCLSAFTCPPPLLPLCRLGWGRGGPYQSSAQSYFGRHHRCHHHRHRLCRPRDRPGGAGPMTRGIPTPGRQLALTWRGCCRRLCSRRHPPHQPMAVAAAAAADGGGGGGVGNVSTK